MRQVSKCEARRIPIWGKGRDKTRLEGTERNGNGERASEKTYLEEAVS